MIKCDSASSCISLLIFSINYKNAENTDRLHMPYSTQHFSQPLSLGFLISTSFALRFLSCQKVDHVIYTQHVYFLISYAFNIFILFNILFISNKKMLNISTIFLVLGKRRS